MFKNNFHPPYVKDINFDSHVSVFKVAIKGNVMTNDNDIVNLFIFTL